MTTNIEYGYPPAPSLATGTVDAPAGGLAPIGYNKLDIGTVDRLAAALAASGGAGLVGLDDLSDYAAGTVGHWIANAIPFVVISGLSTTEDVTDEIEARINHAMLNGKHVLIHAGSSPYKISRTLQVKVLRPLNPYVTPPNTNIHFADNSPTHIVGSGGTRTFIATAPMDSMMEFIFNVDFSNIGPFYSVVENVGFNGAGLAIAAIKSDYTMHMGYISNRFEGVERGIEYNGYGVFEARRNVFRCKYGIYMLGDGAGGGDSLIDCNDFYCAGVAGAAVYAGWWSGNTRFTNNVLTDEVGGVDWFGVHLAGVTAPASQEIRHWVIENNEFSGLRKAIYARGKVGVNIYALNITKNHTSGFGGRNTGTLLDADLVRGITITENFCNEAGIDVSTEPSIILSNCRNVRVTGSNQFGNYNATPIQITDCLDTVVAGNQFVDVGRTSTTTPVVSVIGASNFRIRVLRNQVLQTSGTYSQVFVQESGGAVNTDVRDNDLDGVLSAGIAPNWYIGIKRHGVGLVNTYSEVAANSYTAKYQASNTSGPTTVTYKSRAGGTAVLSGDQLGAWDFYGAHGAGDTLAARIEGRASPGPSGTNVFAILDFYTYSQGAGAISLAMRIDSQQNVIPGSIAVKGTTDTTGFLYVPRTAGVPTGAPAAYDGCPVVVDSTNNRVYFRVLGTWKYAALT